MCQCFTVVQWAVLLGALWVWRQALAVRRDDFRARILSDSAVRSFLAVSVPLVENMDFLRLGHGFDTSFLSWPSHSDGVQVMEVERWPSSTLPVFSPYGSISSGPVGLIAHHQDFAIAESSPSAGPAFARSFVAPVWLFRVSNLQSTRSSHGTLAVLQTSFQALLAWKQRLHIRNTPPQSTFNLAMTKQCSTLILAVSDQINSGWAGAGLRVDMWLSPQVLLLPHCAWSYGCRECRFRAWYFHQKKSQDKQFIKSDLSFMSIPAGSFLPEWHSSSHHTCHSGLYQ